MAAFSMYVFIMKGGIMKQILRIYSQIFVAGQDRVTQSKSKSGLKELFYAWQQSDSNVYMHVGTFSCIYSIVPIHKYRTKCVCK